jgi:putative Flp pilus-assembly TadE/G-like protein
MKPILARRRSGAQRPESGQAVMFVVLALGIFLLAAMAFAVDMANLWFHRQAAQTAADAACTAGAMDVLVSAEGGATGHQGFAIGTPFSCSSTPNAIPCRYAALNGYDGANTTPGNDVSVSFPSSVPGVSTPPSAIAGTYPFMRVDVQDRVKTMFSGMLSGSQTQNVRAFAVCGVVLAQSPIPILVLDPVSPNTTPPQSALNIQGNGTIAIVGGPSKSIQVNSSFNASSCGQSNCSVNLPWGSARVDLSLGGPNGTGSDFGLFGAPISAPGGFVPGSSGHWVPHSAPLSDPFALVCAPGQGGCPLIQGSSAPSAPTTGPQVPTDEGATRFPASPCTSIPCSVAYKDHGCPETSATRSNGKCVLYTPGLYKTSTGFPTGIQVGPGGGTSGTTALFDPGLYYVVGGLHLNSNSTVRPGTGAGDGSGGVVFYFSGSGTVTVASNSGSINHDAFNTLSGPVDSTGARYPNDSTHTNVTYGNGVKCAGTTVVPSNLQNGGAGVNIQGNILLGACTGYYGDPLGASDPIGIQHNFLFFQDRSAQSVQPSWGGGGQFLLAGTMYFHSCNAAGTGVGCGAAGTYYNDNFSLNGNSGSGTYVLGNIVTDNLILGGTSGITMDLNPNPAYNVLKASLLR